MPILRNFPMKDNRPEYTKRGHFFGVGKAGELVHQWRIPKRASFVLGSFRVQFRCDLLSRIAEVRELLRRKRLGHQLAEAPRVEWVEGTRVHGTA